MQKSLVVQLAEHIKHLLETKSVWTEYDQDRNLRPLLAILANSECAAADARTALELVGEVHGTIEAMDLTEPTHAAYVAALEQMHKLAAVSS